MNKKELQIICKLCGFTCDDDSDIIIHYRIEHKEIWEEAKRGLNKDMETWN